MNISQLQYFLAVYDCGSYTTAAQTMYTSRQTLGRAVSELEKEVGHALFTRKGRGIEPTVVGAEAADIARTIVANAHRLTSFADGVSAAEEPEPFTLAVACEGCRGAIVDEKGFRAALEKARLGHVELRFMPSEQCLVAVIRGIADAALTLGRADYAEYESELVGGCPALVAMSRNNPLAHRKTLVINDLHAVEVALPGNLSSYYLRINEVCKASGFEPEWRCVGGDASGACYESALRDFLKGGGVAFVYENADILKPQQQTAAGASVSGRQSDIVAIPVDASTKLNYPLFFQDMKGTRTPQGRAVMRAIMSYLE